MGVLARASRSELETAFEAARPRLGMLPEEDVIRPAETGTVMLEGRAGGAGRRFNLGEATVTRCVVRLNGILGFAYALGRDKAKAHLAARLDALLQDPARRDLLIEMIVHQLARAQGEAKETASRKAAATKVDFFTLVRGD
jgi:alpha-D-ribose 1-methylphosphonate 5-triphosphate synthase subunit PhnG